MSMMVAKQSFTFVDTDGPGRVEEGERVSANHALVRDHPQHFRSFGLDDELRVRSERVND
jgi:hypothetical protein